MCLNEWKEKSLVFHILNEEGLPVIQREREREREGKRGKKQVKVRRKNQEEDGGMCASSSSFSC